MDDEPITVRHNPDASRFEATVDGQLCRLDYRLEGTVMQLLHTEVPAALEGRGLASRLSAAAFEHAGGSGLQVLPVCSYVRAWVQRHPEHRDLLAS